MSVGYEVLNDSGGILLDANYPNLSLIAKGTVDVGSNISKSGRYGQVRVPNTGMPIVFIRSDNFAAIVGAEPGAFTYFLGTGATRFDYWAFGPPQDIGAKLGMQVFTEDSRIAFDATQRYLKIIGSMDTTATLRFPGKDGVGSIASFSLPEGMPAICFCDPGYQYNVLSGTDGFGGYRLYTIAQCAMRISGSTLDLALVQNAVPVDYPTNANVLSYGGATPRSIILADVYGQ